MILNLYLRALHWFFCLYYLIDLSHWCCFVLFVSSFVSSFSCFAKEVLKELPFFQISFCTFSNVRYDFILLPTFFHLVLLFLLPNYVKSLMLIFALSISLFLLFDFFTFSVICEHHRYFYSFASWFSCFQTDSPVYQALRKYFFLLSSAWKSKSVWLNEIGVISRLWIPFFYIFVLLYTWFFSLCFLFCFFNR